MRERKVINYKFGDFTSPRSVRQMKPASSRVISKDEQLAHVRLLDPLLRRYHEASY